MTDPSPRAGFTVGSPAEVERSLLPLSFPSPVPSPSRAGHGFSHLTPGSTLPPTSSIPRRAYTSYSITGNLSLFSRCPYPYLSFVLPSIVLRFPSVHRARARARARGVNSLDAITCGSRRAVANTFSHSLTTLNSLIHSAMYFIKRPCIKIVY